MLSTCFSTCHQQRPAIWDQMESTAQVVLLPGWSPPTGLLSRWGRHLVCNCHQRDQEWQAQISKWVLSRTAFEFSFFSSSPPFYFLFFFFSKGIWQPYRSRSLRNSVSVKVFPWKHISVMCLVPRTPVPPFASTISNAIIQISWNQSYNESHHMIVIIEGNE